MVLPGQPRDPAASSPDVLAGGGELGALMRQMDWSATSLGPTQNWPQALKTSVRIMLTSRQPMFVWWGDRLINLYNDAYRAIVGGKHPWALGQPASVVWREIWHQVGPRAQTAMFQNEGTYDEALLLIMERHGYPEETYYTFSYSPVPSDEGGTGGIICANTDDTQRIIGERQLALLRDLAAGTADARTLREACESSARALAANLWDLPFALVYLLNPDQTSASLAAASGIDLPHPAAPPAISLREPSLWTIAEVVSTNAPILIWTVELAAVQLPFGAWNRPPACVVALPIGPSGQNTCLGALIVGLNPYRLYDDNYRGFLALVAGQISAAIANAQAYEAERRRAEALAELDRVKTAFFSNVSHEFRTPLTLLLGTLEEVLELSREAVDPGKDLIATAHRNGLRLLKLVNSLLDFSRIEAGRVQACYQPTDIASFTAELASSFRSAIERARLGFHIDCRPVGQLVYVDRDMWEKVVLNLLSNAFKFTFEGEIGVAVRPSADGSAVELVVRDTGTGIPARELPRLFERFHRVEGSRGRTHEGTGIGLALVQELVKLHGGKVSVTSCVNAGTDFTVSIPFGTAHLPEDRIGVGESLVSTATRADVYVEEALRWLPSHEAALPAMAESGPGECPRARLLLVDDNADMRDYVRRLLGTHHDVEMADNGHDALRMVLDSPPDLVLSDVMMPGLDGFELLRALRENPTTATLPVILLSARAGEESRVEGLHAGADDYLVKPFTARELVARVNAHIATSRLRRQAAERERDLREKAEGVSRELEMSNRALRRANGDLEQFAYSASHDLQEPLRMVATYSQLLLRTYRGKLDSRADEIIEHCVQGATRMERLIKDLLEYTRASSAAVSIPAASELDAALDAALSSLSTAIEEAGASIFREPLPAVRIEPAHAQQILQNLIGNAIKYRDSKPPEIRVTANRLCTEWVVAVHDNGIGIHPRYQDQVFGLFKRLHSANRYPGTGLGLAICKKLVERYGGRIWLESEPGSGSSFFFTLPAEENP